MPMPVDLGDRSKRLRNLEHDEPVDTRFDLTCDAFPGDRDRYDPASGVCVDAQLQRGMHRRPHGDAVVDEEYRPASDPR